MQKRAAHAGRFVGILRVIAIAAEVACTLESSDLWLESRIGDQIARELELRGRR